MRLLSLLGTRLFLYRHSHRKNKTFVGGEVLRGLSFISIWRKTMEKTILLGDKEMKFKSSAATNILFKRAFHEDVLLLLTDYSKNLKELKKIQAKVDELRADSTRPKEEVLAEMNEYLNAPALTASREFQSDTLPKLAFIMWLEANESEKLFSKLNEEQYLFWLLTIDQDELGGITGEIMEIWQSGAKTHSKPKN